MPALGGWGGAISALERAEGRCICLDSDVVESVTDAIGLGRGEGFPQETGEHGTS